MGERAADSMPKGSELIEPSPSSEAGPSFEGAPNVEDTFAHTAQAASGPDDDEIGPGVRIDHFRVKRLLGEGGMGRVFLARDTVLGRLVALKMIRPVLLEENGIERLLKEARTTARFNHPNIVMLLAAGEWRSQPYIALEYVEGESLAERLQRDAPRLQEILRNALAIARALEHAHERGILHCDLKPANIVIPKDGRLRVLDFGVAAAVSRVAPSGALEAGPLSALTGTPAYMAPEQMQGGSLSAATDVFALGLILYEMIEGKRPLSDRERIDLYYRGWKTFEPRILRADLDSRLTDLVIACLAIDPARRPSASKLAGTIEQLLSTGPRSLAEGAEPFRGLAPFDEAHSTFFFGRDEEISAFMEQLRDQPVLPIIGASGAGKSSFVRAGIVPRLREQGSWRVITLRPGDTPIHALASRLAGTPSSSGVPAMRATIHALEERLRHSTGALNLILGEIAAETRSKVFLFVDQLEELYTNVADPHEQQRFLELLLAAADDPDEPVRVALTLRDDFLGRLQLTPALRKSISRVIVIRAMDRKDLRETIVRPIEAVGYRFDNPELPDRMLDEVQTDATALPVLQFTCKALWERRDASQHLVLSAAFAEMGGVAGALVRHAESVLDGLSAEDLRTARAMLLRLVTAEGTRRVVSRELVLAGQEAGAEQVLTRLIESRLVSIRKASGEGGMPALIELAHESLVRRWPQLARWIDESREERALLGELSEAAAL